MESRNKQQIELKTIDIKGKAYVTVNERIRIFRNDEQFKGYRLVTTPLIANENIAFFTAQVFDANDKLVANGHSQELQSSSFINKTSHIENAETSAIGRALGSLGIGIDTSFCSADELLVALQGQTEKQTTAKGDYDKKQELLLNLKDHLGSVSSTLEPAKKVELLKKVTGKDNWSDLTKMSARDLQDILIKLEN